MGGKQSKESSVQVVNVKRREENLPVYAEGEKGLSTTTAAAANSDSSNGKKETPPAQSSDNTSAPVENSSSSVDSNMIEVVAANVDDLQNGQMKEVEVAEQKVLLVKEDGQFYAIGNKCTHYGAPLSKGAYCKGVVRCPWHGACFNVKTGDIEDFPGLDSVQTFQVEVRGSDVVVKADTTALETAKRVKPMVKKTSENKKTVLLIGGGPASVVCAETLRQEGYTGRIILVSQESCLPYDRIKLSKAMNIKPEEIALRSQEFYTNNDIELVLGKKVTEVMTADNKVVLEDGTDLTYNTLVLATGGQPRRLPITGIDLGNVYFLRTPSDANSIAENAQGKNVVIVGSSFIGMEVASFLADKAASVSVVDLVKVPFQLTLGEKLGSFMQKLHESKGVKFHFETSVSEFRGEDGKVTEAVLANGTVIPADVCVMGVGVVPATDFLKFSGVDMTSRGFIPVTKSMQTNVSNVYAAGDIVEFPLFTQGDNSVNIQHWQMAHMHGRIAGLSISGKSTEIRSVPYFWTAQFGKNVRYTGYGPGYEDVVLHGDLDENKFVAYYTKGDAVVAVASLGWDPIVSQAAELMSKGGSLTKAEITDSPDSWLSRLSSLTN